MGIAQCSIRLNHTQKSRKDTRVKRLPVEKVLRSFALLEARRLCREVYDSEKLALIGR